MPPQPPLQRARRPLVQHATGLKPLPSPFCAAACHNCIVHEHEHQLLPVLTAVRPCILPIHCSAPAPSLPVQLVPLRCTACQPLWYPPDTLLPAHPALHLLPLLCPASVCSSPPIFGRTLAFSCTIQLASSRAPNCRRRPSPVACMLYRSLHSVPIEVFAPAYLPDCNIEHASALKSTAAAVAVIAGRHKPLPQLCPSRRAAERRQGGSAATPRSLPHSYL